MGDTEALAASELPSIAVNACVVGTAPSRSPPSW
jgi:hypothetical protein